MTVGKENSKPILIFQEIAVGSFDKIQLRFPASAKYSQTRTMLFSRVGLCSHSQWFSLLKIWR
jgi:hypothetical protein